MSATTDQAGAGRLAQGPVMGRKGECSQLKRRGGVYKKRQSGFNPQTIYVSL